MKKTLFAAAAVLAMSMAVPAFAEQEGGGPGWQAPPFGQAQPTQSAPAHATPAPAHKDWQDGQCNKDVNGKGCWEYKPTQNGNG